MNLRPRQPFFCEKRIDKSPEPDAVALRFRPPPDTFFKNAVADWDWADPAPLDPGRLSRRAGPGVDGRWSRL